MPILLGATIPVCVEAQNAPDQSLNFQSNIVTDRTFGISFAKIGRISGNTASGYTMSLASASGTIRQATSTVSVTQRQFVDLSGSYGGRFFLDDTNVTRILGDRVAVDTLLVGGLKFRREYWAVYAGMGMWEGVVNCYAFSSRHYYTLSLEADIHAGKPGEVVEGHKLDGGYLRAKVADALRDNREPIIRKFNELLSSFRLKQGE